LVLCDCLIHEKIHDDADQWIFTARQLDDDAQAMIHVMMPKGKAAAASSPSRNGSLSSNASDENALAIVKVRRRGDVISMCCRSLEADTLAELVRQHDGLPLSLATESLLGTVRALEQIAAEGLEPVAISAEQLLLDDDGIVHLSGNDLVALFERSIYLATARVGPTDSILRSLGKLFDQLQTGSGTEGEVDADGVHLPSARFVRNRLLGNAEMPAYRHWEDVIHDLELLKDGQEITDWPESQAALTPADRQAIPSRPDGSDSTATNRWLAWAVALAALGIAAVWAIATH